MSARTLLPAVGLCLLLGPGWAWAQLPPSVSPYQPNLSNSPALPARFPGQSAATPPPFVVPAAGDQTPPARMAPAIALPAGLSRTPVAAAGTPTDPAALPAAAPNVARLTLDEVKQRVRADNKLLQLAALNVQSKGYATRATQANYFPQIIGQSVYLHFNDFLGSVLTTGRHVTGPKGVPLPTFPSNTINLPVV